MKHAAVPTSSKSVQRQSGARERSGAGQGASALAPPHYGIGLADAGTSEAIRDIAARGVSSAGGPLPHLQTIQRAFGPEYDLSSVRAHIGGQAALASRALGATAYASGNDVAFESAPDLHTAAHEAAHVVQQRQGVQLQGGVGRVGDAYEQHADAMADRVVSGRSASDLLTAGPGGGGTGAAIQGIWKYIKSVGSYIGKQLGLSGEKLSARQKAERALAKTHGAIVKGFYNGDPRAFNIDGIPVKPTLRVEKGSTPNGNVTGFENEEGTEFWFGVVVSEGLLTRDLVSQMFALAHELGHSVGVDVLPRIGLAGISGQRTEVVADLIAAYAVNLAGLSWDKILACVSGGVKSGIFDKEKSGHHPPGKDRARYVRQFRQELGSGKNIDAALAAVLEIVRKKEEAEEAPAGEAVTVHGAEPVR